MLICSVPLDAQPQVVVSKCDFYMCVLLIYRWLLRRGCTGSRNFLDAFRKAVENEEEKAHGIGKLRLTLVKKIKFHFQSTPIFVEFIQLHVACAHLIFLKGFKGKGRMYTGFLHGLR